MGFKYFLNGLYKRKIMIILLTIQMVITTYFIMGFVNIVIYDNKLDNYFNDNYPIERGAWLSMIMFTEGDSVEDNYESVKELYTRLKNDNRIERFDYYNMGMIDPKELNIDYEKYNEVTNISKILNEIPENIPVFYLNEDYQEFLKDKIKGVGFNKNNNSKYTEVILGANFNKDFKVGDILGGKYEVVGFMKRLIAPKQGGNPISAFQNFDNTIIMDLQKDITVDPYDLSSGVSDSMIEVKPGVDLNEVIRDVNIWIKELDLGQDSEITSYKSFIEDEFWAIKYPMFAFEGIKTGIFMVISIFTLSVSLVYSINMRKKEFGIMFSLGAKNKEIYKLISMEVLVSLVISIIASSVLIIKNWDKFAMYCLFNDYIPQAIMCSTGIMVLVSIIAMVVPVLKIRKLKIQELIGGFRE